MANQIGAQWQAGDVILDVYKVTGIVGQNELGEIYQVRHLAWDINVLAKCLKPETVATLGSERLKQAIADWTRLGVHPHIAYCHYLRSVDEQSFIVSEWVPGGSLGGWISDRRLYAGSADQSLRRILDIAIQIAWALDYAHQQRAVHQYLQPESVLLTADGTVKLTDFGLAPVPVVDAWGWGLLVLQMFAGERLWAGDSSPLQALEQYLRAGASPQFPPMPGQLAQLLRRCFQPQSEHAQVSLQQVAQELEQIYQQVAGQPYARPFPDMGSTLANNLNNQALAFWDLGQPEEAWKIWEQIISSIDPQHLESIYNRGLMLWRSIGVNDDLALVKRLQTCRQPSNENQIDYLLSLIHLERGDVETALKLLQGLQDRGAQPEPTTTLTLAKELATPAKQLLANPNLAQIFAHPNCTTIALSLGSRYALSAGTDQTVKLWDVARGQTVCTFRGHTANVTCVTFSPNGNYILSGSEDKTIRLAEVVTTSYVHIFKGHWGAVRSIAFSRDGYYFLSGSDDRTLKLWDVTKGKCLQTLRGHRGRVSAVAFSPDGRTAYSTSEDRTLKVWDLSNGRCIRTVEGLVGEVRSIAISTDGQYLLLADQLVRLWDAHTGQELRALQGNRSGVQSVQFSPDGQYALASDDQTLKLWNINTGRCLRTFEGHNLPIRSAALSPDGYYAVSADAEGMRLWAVNCGALSYVAPFRLSQAQAIVTQAEGDVQFQQAVALAQAAQTKGDWVNAMRYLQQARFQPGYNRATAAMQVWQSLYAALPRQGFSQGWERATLTRHTDAVQTVAYSLDGQVVLSGGDDGTIRLWEVTTERCVRSLEGHRAAVTAVDFNRDSSYALSASQDATLKLWAVATGSCVQTFRGHQDAVKAVRFSPDGHYALSGSADRTIKLWDVMNNRCMRTLTAHQDSVNAIEFSPDGSQAVSGSSDGSVKLWHVATGDSIRSFSGHGGAVYAVAFSSDKQYVLSASADQTVKLWDVSTGHCVLTLEGHTAAVRSVVFTLDSRFALSGADDRTLKLWDVATGRCLYTLEGHTAAVNAVALSVDGSYALSGSDDQTCKLWVLDWNLAERSPTPWDERARPYLETFLTLHTPAAGNLPVNREPIEAEVVQALMRRGTPTWTEADFLTLLHTLKGAGYGWLEPEGVRQQLATMSGALSRSAAISPPTPEPEPERPTAFDTAFDTAFATAFGTSTLEQSRPSVKVILSVSEGSLKGEEFEFANRTTCVIGRAKDCNLQLPNDEQHKTISRYHCLLELNPPAIRIRDLGSLHGTYVNGQMIGRRAPNQTPEQVAQLNLPVYDLQPGDEIKLGKTVFQVRVEGDVPDATSFGTAMQFPAQTAIGDSVPASNGLAGKSAVTPVVPSDIVSAGSLEDLQVDGYDVLNQLSSDPFKQVYLARRQQTDELVTLKVMMPQTAVRMPVIEAFLHEVENTRALQHPHIVQLLDSGYVNGKFFFVWEHCDRGSVADLVQQQGKLTIEMAIDLTLQVLAGLEYAHSATIPYVKLLDGSYSPGRGLVHRDLNPANLLLAMVQDIPTVKIADYGLTKAFDLAGLSGLAPSQATTEAARFMPRQQAINFNYAKPEVDVWSTVACLYHLLTGAYPRDFANKDPYLVVLQNEPVPIRQRNPEVPKQLAELIDMALVDNPDLCFKNATAFKLALKSVV